MAAALGKAFNMVFLICFGYFLKRVGLFKQEDSKFLVKMMLYVTLPAILINAFRGFVMDYRLLVFALIGILVNVVILIIAWKTGARHDPKVQAMYMLCFTGYNIGSFGMPFIQNFFPEMVLSVVMFDVGNTIMNCGVTNAFAVLPLKRGEKTSPKALILDLLKTHPFSMYIVLFAISAVGFQFPEPVYNLTETVAAGNTVIVMIMLGLMFEVRLTKTARRQVAEILVVRTVSLVALALLLYFFLPFPVEYRQAAALLTCCPITSMAAIYCAKLDCDPDVYGTAMSLAIPISVVVMVSFVLIWAI